MVVASSSNTQETLIYNVKISSVGPGQMTRPGIIHEPTNLNLAMKLHYLKGVYYFKSHESFRDLTIMKIKEAMFEWLNQFYVICGRFRRSESSRPYIKCNDCGVRLVEAQCHKTIDEWLKIINENNIKNKNVSLEKDLLISSHNIGPELAFSPNVFIQITKFKCDGLSIGISWAHVLGDAYFASDFLNMWGKILARHQPGPPPTLAEHRNIEISPSPIKLVNDPLSLKRVDPVGNNWLVTSNKKSTFSFHVSAAKLSRLQSDVSGPKKPDLVPPFESLCAVIWHCVVKVRNGQGPKVVTILKHDPCTKNKGIFNDNQVINIVNGDLFAIESCDIKGLASLIINQSVDDREKIEEIVENENGVSDFIVYGANLTFVNLEDVTFYELELKGKKPINVSYSIDCIGDEGVVLVLPTSNNDGGGGRVVTITLPENELLEMKHALKESGLLSII